jgi:hypothetical protein
MISAMGQLPMQGLIRSRKVHSAFSIVAGANCFLCSASHSSAMTPKVSALECRPIRRWTAGSTPVRDWAASLVPLLPRAGESNVGVLAEGQQLLPSVQAVLEAPEASAGRRDLSGIAPEGKHRVFVTVGDSDRCPWTRVLAPPAGVTEPVATC